MTVWADDSKASLIQYFLTHVYLLGFTWAQLCS